MLIFKLSCPDRPGLVAKIAQFVASHQGNLKELNQFTDTLKHRFFARLEVEIDALDLPIESFIQGFGLLADSIDAQWHCRQAPFKIRTAILVTRTTHCLNEILWRAAENELPLEITSIIGNREDCREIAEKEGIPFHHIEMRGDQREAGFERIAEILKEEKVEFGILARFMQILPDWFCAEFAEQIINIHHSFLPAFIGANPYRQAYERGVKLIGATCHYVTPDLDAGPIIDQQVRRVLHSHGPKDLIRLGRDCERAALARGIRYHTYERTLIDGNRAIVFED